MVGRTWAPLRLGLAPCRSLRGPGGQLQQHQDDLRHQQQEQEPDDQLDDEPDDQLDEEPQTENTNPLRIHLMISGAERRDDGLSGEAGLARLRECLDLCSLMQVD